MSEDEILVGAYPVWRNNDSHSRNVDLYPDEDYPRPMSAEDALIAFEVVYDDPKIWEDVDWPRLKRRFIDYINYRLQREGLTYDQVMRQRKVMTSIR